MAGKGGKERGGQEEIKGGERQKGAGGRQGGEGKVRAGRGEEGKGSEGGWSPQLTGCGCTYER